VEAPATGSDRADRASERVPGALGARLDEIEAAVTSGGADLKALGFWPIVATVKRDRALIAAHADQIGRIDAAAFRRFVGRWRLPAHVGTAVLVAGAVVGLVAAIAGASVDDPTWAGVLLIAAGAIWTVALHSPTHHLVGWLAGIRFTDYFVGGPPPPRPGIKTDYATYLRADPGSRAWMHASGALATKVAPFLALAFVPASTAPWWAPVTLVGIGIVQILTDVAFSVTSGDWKKFRRERAVAKAMARAADSSPATVSPD
jgi:hypothetical protein